MPDKFTPEDMQSIMNAQSVSTLPAEPVEPTPAEPTIEPQNQGAPAPGSPDPSEAPEPSSPAPVDDEIVSLTELFGGKYNSVDELISDYDKLQKELNDAKQNPQFKSERHKKLYEFGAQVEEMELERAAELLNIIKLDLNKVPDQHLRFEAFKLDPKNKGMSQEDLQNLFMDEEQSLYGDPSQDGGQSEVQRIRAKQATNQAREQIQKIQNEWTEARAATPSSEDLAKQLQEYKAKVETGLKTFAGIQHHLTADEEGKKVEAKLNFTIQTPQERQSVVDAVANPEEWLGRKLHSLGIINEGNEKEPINIGKFAEFVSKIEFHDTLVNLAYTQGRADKFADEMAKRRNADLPNNGSSAPGEPGKKLNEFDDAKAHAAKAAGLI
jgi:hypothetical protein